MGGLWATHRSLAQQLSLFLDLSQRVLCFGSSLRLRNRLILPPRAQHVTQLAISVIVQEHAPVHMSASLPPWNRTRLSSGSASTLHQRRGMHVLGPGTCAYRCNLS